MNQLTEERLKELFTYDPETGHFVRKIKVAARTRVGEVAGSSHEGYIRMTVDRKSYQAHRLAYLYMTGSFPTGIVDHIDHDKSNNRWENLRIVSHQENCKNFSLNQNNTSGQTGVYWHKRDKKWIAFIYVDGIKKHIGSFKDKDDAIKAREKANINYGFHKNHGKEVA